MNIFVLDYDIEKCAVYHTDKHIVKMILESTQLLCNCVNDAPYRKTHLNHPCSKWVAESIENWLWLCELVIALNSEYKYRFNRSCDHKSYTVTTSLSIPELPKLGLTTFALAMPDLYKCGDAVKSYREYYIKEKSHLFKWTNRETPQWIQTES